MQLHSRPFRGTVGLLSALLLTGLVSVAAASWQDASPWEGRDVFEKKGCSSCHAVNGSGGDVGPDLGRRRFYGTYLQLAARMWNHLPGMLNRIQRSGQSFQVLTIDQMSQLVSYLTYLRYLGEPGNERRGRQLIGEKGCARCHQFGGVGGTLGPNISAMQEYMSPLRLAESMWNHGPALMKAFEDHNIPRPKFRGDEFLDLAVGIRSFMSPSRTPASAFDLGSPTQGEQLVSEKGCVHCHSFDDSVRTLGPGLAHLPMDYSVTQLAGEMWNHGPEMWQAMEAHDIEILKFEPGEMADVLAYLYSLKLKDEAGEPDRGRKVLEDGGCFGCHSLAGTGRGTAPDLSLLGNGDSPLVMVTQMWNHAPRMRMMLQAQGIRWPRLSGRQMADLYAYLQSVSGDQ